jgi:hypothetical protein
MKNIVFIACLFFLQPAIAQVKKEKKIVWHNEALQSFFLHAKQQIPFIQFKKDYQGRLEIQPANTSQQTNRLVYDNWYSVDYAGHQYLFEKEYGGLQIEVLQNKLDSLRLFDCYEHFYEGRIYADHIDIKVTAYCPGKTADEDRIFFKVENRPGYLGGPKHFQQVVRDRLACTGYQSYLYADSAFFFFAVTKKDSMCHEAYAADSVQSPLRNLIIQALTNTYGWKPYNKDGRNMNAYLQVFIYIRKDGTILADYLR